MSAGVTRRSLGGLSAALTLPVMGRVEDGVLIARVEDFVAAHVEERAMLASLSDEDRATARAYVLKLIRNGKQTHLDRKAAAIAKLRARTPEGLRAKARAAAWNAGGDDTALPRLLLGDALLASLLADLTGLPHNQKGARA